MSRTLSNPISISNIAWDTSQDEEVGEQLKKLGVEFIDIAPSKYFGKIIGVSRSEIEQIKRRWKDYGIQIYGMQSLLFGLNNLNLFASEKDRTLLLEHLKAICRIGGGLGVNYLTFGSPNNRFIKEKVEEEAEEIALDFFYELGQIAKEHNVTVCIEPNPKEYGANFLTTSIEAYSFVRKLNHKNIKMQIDTGTCIINGEDCTSTIDKKIIGHVHASAPFLETINEKNISSIRSVLRKIVLPDDKVVTIEMLYNERSNTILKLTKAIELLRFGIYEEGA